MGACCEQPSWLVVTFHRYCQACSIVRYKATLPPLRGYPTLQMHGMAVSEGVSPVGRELAVQDEGGGGEEQQENQEANVPDAGVKPGKYQARAAASRRQTSSTLTEPRA
jgi:hypothetical protein